MKKTMKKIISLLLGICFIGSISSCAASYMKSSTERISDNTNTASRQKQSVPLEQAEDSGNREVNVEVAPEMRSEIDMFYGIEEDDSWRYVPVDPEEEYTDVTETPFKDVATSPLSTFSADVDTASYSNMRRFIQNGQIPEGVRVEEFINYFDYDFSHSSRKNEHPFTVFAEIGECPWEKDHGLAMVSIKGEDLSDDRELSNNIVFLLDVSGSMDASNKLPLLQESFKLLIEQLDEDDMISIVTYAGSEQVIADSVPGNEHTQLKRKIDSLWAGGSTAGASGITTAYELAEKNFIEGGNNRIILATDGDFNVGPSSVSDLESLIEKKRENGVFITVLGFGMYNLKDNMMETIADKGNGNYAYIDTIEEARKVLVEEFDSTMYTIAKDVKFQVEFNPEIVSEYRLIGYDNRRLENEDFENDLKDAGDIGAGHTVTVFYEIVYAGNGDGGNGNLKYQQMIPTGSDEMMTVSIRYKKPDEDTSILTETIVDQKNYAKRPSNNFQFASAVTEYALILKDSEFKGNASLSHVQDSALAAIGEDEYGLRREFVQLVEMYRNISDSEVEPYIYE